MTSSSQRVAKNTSILMLSQLVTTALSMFLVIIQPRIIGDVGFGSIAYAESIWGMAVVFVLFGMDVLIMKEVARKPEDSQKLLSTAVFLLIPLYLLSAILVAVWTISHNFSDEEILVIVIFGVASFIWQFSFLYRATLIGLEHIGAISKADIIGKVFNTFVGLAVLYVTRNVVAMAWVGVGMASLTHLIQWRYLRRYFTLTLQIDYGYAWQLLRSGVPYMLSALFLAGYTRADTLIMRELLNREAIGWYSTSDRLFGTLLFVPTAFIGAMFPLMSRTYANDRDALPKMIQRSFGLMLILGVPIGMGLFAMAQPIINMLYGAEFFNTGAILSM
ncbi:MAG TPA: flippase, partial [Anaerolineae bacterium]|nr:flippase [Anaerolineae bacterium]